MRATATQPTGKRSKRGRLSEGRPTKQTDVVVTKIAASLALGLSDDEAAAIAGINEVTLTRWKRDQEFCRKIKNAVSTRLAMRLSKIESGADGWQGTAWLLERLYPQRFSRPEVQISLQNTFNPTTNVLTIVISKEEYQQINAQAEESRTKIREMFAAYRPGALSKGNGADLDLGAAISDSVQEKVCQLSARFGQRCVAAKVKSYFGALNS